MVKILPILLAFNILVSCTASPNEEVLNIQENILESGSGYSITLPEEMFIYGSNRFASTIPPPKKGEFPIYDDLLKASDYDLRVYDISDSCKSSYTGASKTSNLDGYTIWGKVDAWDIGLNSNTENILCRPPLMKFKIEPDGREILQSHAYALCSEKDGKTVIVCIGQMKDDPKMAEEIFKTFRWLE